MRSAGLRGGVKAAAIILGVLVPSILELMPGSAPAAPDTVTPSSGLFRERLYDPASPEDSVAYLKDLRHRIRRDRYDVEARRELASLLSISDRIEDRREAADALMHALKVNSDDSDLWARLARLRRRQRYVAESQRAFSRALELKPESGDLWNEMAAQRFQLFQRFDTFDDLFQADNANRRAMRYLPESAAAIRRAVRITLVNGNLAPMDSLLKRWRDTDPHDGWPYLVEGMLACEEESFERADSLFDLGWRFLPEYEREAFKTLAIVAPHEHLNSSLVPDSTRFVEDYWKWNDPTPADSLNERQLEHYARLVKADMFFQIEERGLRGWEHAPGELTVRFGLPDNWAYGSDIYMGKSIRLFPTSPFAHPTRYIRYGTGDVAFEYRFIDFAMNGVFFRSRSLGNEFIAQHPSIYALPFEQEPFDQEIEIWRFFDRNGRGRTEIVAALSPEEWSEPRLSLPEYLGTKVAVYDPHWNITEEADFSWGDFSLDPSGRLVGVWELDGSQDSMVVGLETREDDGPAYAGKYVGLPQYAITPEGLLLSELAILRDVGFDDGGPPEYRRYDGRGMPNPGHVFAAGEPIGLGFEVYHLSLDPAGLHRVDVRVTLERISRRGVFKILLGSGGSSEAMEFESAAPGDRLDRLMAVAVPELRQGEYRLRVEVQDQLNGTRDYREVPLTIEGSYRP